MSFKAESGTEELLPVQQHDFIGLVQRVRAGDTQPFLDLVEPHLLTVFRVTGSMLRNRADAEEVVQETVLKALMHLDQLRDCQCVKGWLLQIAVNEARMRMRITRRFQSGSEHEDAAATEDCESIGVLRTLADKRELPSQTVERKELWAAARRSLLKLDPRYREVFVLRDMHGLTVSQTVMILGIGESVVNTRLHRARQQMRELMTPLFRHPRVAWKPLKVFGDLDKRYKYKVVNCRTVLDEMRADLDGTLPEGDRLEIERRLKYCSRCMLLLDTTRRILQVVADEETFAKSYECNIHWDRVFAEFSRRQA